MKVTNVGVWAKKSFHETVLLKGRGKIYSPISAEYPSFVMEGSACLLVIPVESSTNSNMEVTLNGENCNWGVEQMRIELSNGDIVKILDDARLINLSVTMSE